MREDSNSHAIPLLDRAKIDVLRDCLGTEDLLLGLAELYDESLADLQRIEKALAASDLEEVRRAAHRLKGMSGNFGARRLSSVAEWIELGSWDQLALRRRLPELVEAIEATRSLAEEICSGAEAGRLT